MKRSSNGFFQTATSLLITVLLWTRCLEVCLCFCSCWSSVVKGILNRNSQGNSQDGHVAAFYFTIVIFDRGLTSIYFSLVIVSYFFFYFHRSLPNAKRCDRNLQLFRWTKRWSSWVNELQYFEYWNLRLAKPGHISTFILIDAVKHLYKCQNRKISNAVAWCISLKRALWLCSSRYISCTWCYIDDTPSAPATAPATATAWSIRFLLCKILFFHLKWEKGKGMG